MATTDVAPLVTPTYTAALLVPNDGSTLTQALLTNLIVALGNRIELVRGLAPSAAETPESYLLVNEDFLPGAYVNTGDGYIVCQHCWNFVDIDGVGQTQQPWMRVGGPSTVNYGVYEAIVSAGKTWGLALKNPGEGGGIRFGDIEEMTIIAAVKSSNLTSQEAFFGLVTTADITAPGDSAVGLWFKKSTSNFWMGRHKTNGADDATVSGQTVVTQTFVCFRLRRTSSTQVQLFMNDTLLATLTQGTTAPDAADLVSLVLMVNNNLGSAVNLTPWIDFVSLRVAATSRY
jgi:hypothetical protein